jgi:hypothetical protein
MIVSVGDPSHGDYGGDGILDLSGGRGRKVMQEMISKNGQDA